MLSFLPRLLVRPLATSRVAELHLSRTRFLTSNLEKDLNQQQQSTADNVSQKHRDTVQQPGVDQVDETIDKVEYDKLLENTKLIDSKYKRALADMENLRTRLHKELEDSKKYAIQKFCKDLIEITDVMQIALSQISPDAVGQSNYNGIKMIDQRMKDIFSKHGLIALNPIGLKFNPYEHQAVFEKPDASKEPGTISEVCKEGWKLHDRIVRPAVVGVFKKP